MYFDVVCISVDYALRWHISYLSDMYTYIYLTRPDLFFLKWTSITYFIYWWYKNEKYPEWFIFHLVLNRYYFFNICLDPKNTRGRRPGWCILMVFEIEKWHLKFDWGTFRQPSLWYYRLLSFQARGTNLEILLPKNQQYPKEMIEFWELM